MAQCSLTAAHREKHEIERRGLWTSLPALLLFSVNSSKTGAKEKKKSQCLLQLSLKVTYQLREVLKSLKCSLISAITGCKYVLIFFCVQKLAHLHPESLQEEQLEQKAEKRLLRPPFLFNFKGQGEN